MSVPVLRVFDTVVGGSQTCRTGAVLHASRAIVVGWIIGRAVECVCGGSGCVSGEGRQLSVLRGALLLCWRVAV